MAMSSANYCPHCGAETQSDSIFCATCGRPVVGGMGDSDTRPYLISPTRIVLLSILTLGLYTTYWLYKTWKHYKEHTGAEVHPIWHGLTSFVPVYGSFRAHAHLRIYGELAGAAGLAVGFSPGIAFFAILVGWFGVLVWWSVALTLLVQIVSIVAQIYFLLHAQPRINYYWDQVYGSGLRGIGIGKGEVIVVIVGLLFGWPTFLGTLASVF